MPSYVVVGASRGIGLGFIRRLSSDPQNVVFALVRNPTGSPDLQAFVDSLENQYNNIHIVKMDLADYSSIVSAVKEVNRISGGVIDVLINNGALLHQACNQLDLPDYSDQASLEKDMLDFFKPNVIGVSQTINEFLPLLRKPSKTPKRVLVVTSSMGSPVFAKAADSHNCVAYSISKAALNMAVTKFALACKRAGDNIIFLAVCPGLVKTMPGPPEVVDKIYEDIVAEIRKGSPKFRGLVTIEQSVEEQLALLAKLKLEDSGMMAHSSGEPIDAVDGAY